MNGSIYVCGVCVGGSCNHQFVSLTCHLSVALSCVSEDAYTNTHGSLTGYHIISYIINTMHNYKADRAQFSPFGTHCKAFWQRTCKFSDSPLCRIWMRHLSLSFKEINLLRKKTKPKHWRFYLTQCFVCGRNNKEENHYITLWREAIQTPSSSIGNIHKSTQGLSTLWMLRKPQ